MNFVTMFLLSTERYANEETPPKRALSMTSTQSVSGKFISLGLILLAGFIVFGFSQNAQANNVSIEPNSHTQPSNQSPILTSEQTSKIQRIQLPWIKSIDNNGIFDEDHSYYAQLQNGSVFVSSEGITYSIPGANSDGILLKEQFIDSTPIMHVKSGERSATTVTKFLGNDPSKWQTDLKTYSDVWLKTVWQGISVDLKAYQKNVEKIFKVSPIASPDTIHIGLEGATDLSVDSQSGELVVSTKAGEVRMTKPIAYQFDLFGNKSYVDVAYSIDTTSLSYGFTVPSYNHLYDLYIDPLLASTYVGGFQSATVEGEYGLGAIWKNNSIYISGISSSPNAPTLSNSYDMNQNGKSDIVVLKFNDTLTTLEGQTFLGGTGDDFVGRITLDASNNVYVTGRAADGFPTTSNAYDTTFNGGASDAVVVKLSNDLSTLLASTYIGGDATDSSNGITLDASNNVYISGSTNIATTTVFPTTSGAFSSTINGQGDAFISKFTNDLSTLLASTYIGGNTANCIAGNYCDVANYVMIDASGNVIITGRGDKLFPSINGIVGGNSDAIVAKLNNTLTTLIASTNIGSGLDDTAYTMAFDSAGNIYITGQAGSGFLQVPSGNHFTYSGGLSGFDSYVAKFPNSLANIIASVVLGGNANDAGYGIMIDASNKVYVVGYGNTNFPTTPGAFQETTTNQDVAVTVLPSTLTSLTYSTLLGSSGNDLGLGAAIDTSGNVYATGQAFTSGFPASSNAFQQVINGAHDAFVTKFNPSLSSVQASTFYGGYPITTTGNDIGNAIALDSTGNIFVAGVTGSEIPKGVGTYDTTYNGSTDGVIYKFDTTLSTLSAATFIGGTGTETLRMMAIGSDNSVYVAGTTQGTAFPTTSGAYQTTYGGGSGDIFISKFNNALTSLTASTFLGGSVGETGFAMALDSTGNIFVSGLSLGSFPTTSGAYQTVFGGTADGFITKINNNLTGPLLGSTYLGGNGTDSISAIAVDTNNNVYVTGSTSNNSFPTAGGPYDTSFNGGTSDAFVSRLNSTLTTLSASTFLGGNGADSGSGIVYDAQGDFVELTGTAGSGTPAFPTTAGAYQTTFGGGSYDVFVSKLPIALTSLTASTFLGGTGDDNGLAIRKQQNSPNDIVVTGKTTSNPFPTTSLAYDSTFNGGTSDAFISKFNNDGTGNLTTLKASTYVGGSGVDIALALTGDSSNNIFITGQAQDLFPVTSSAYDKLYDGGSGATPSDVFVSKFDTTLEQTMVIPTITNVTSSTPNNTYTVGAPISIQVTFSDPVTVTGSPHLTLELGTTDHDAVYASGTGTTTLTFNYTVVAGDGTGDLDYILAGLILNGGTINAVSGGAAANLATLPAPGASGSLGANKAIVIDTTLPTFDSFTSTTANNTYGNNAVINITANFSEALALTGNSITVVLNTGATVTLAGTFGSTVTGTYTVCATCTTENTTDLTVASITSMTVHDTAGNTITSTTLPPSNIADTSDIKIDTAPPSLLSFSSITPDATYGHSDVINVTATFSEPILGTGNTITVVLNTGATVTLSSVFGSTMTGTYTVCASCSTENTTDLTVASITTLNVTDLHGNTNTSTTLPSSNIATTSDIVIDTAIPSAPVITYPADNDVVGQAVNVQGTCDPLGTVTLTSTNFDTPGTFSGSCDATGHFMIYVMYPTTFTGPDTIHATQIDEAGNGPSAEDTVVVTVQSSNVVTLALAPGEQTPTNNSPIVIRATFALAIDPTTFTTADITTSTTGTNIGALSISEVGTTHTIYDITVPVSAPDGTIQAYIPGGSVETLSNVPNSESNHLSVVFDQTAPVLQSFTSPTPDGLYSHTNPGPITFYAQFNEPIDPTSTLTVKLNTDTPTGVTVVGSVDPLDNTRMIFTYTVCIPTSCTNENTPDLSVALISSISIKDLAGNTNANTTLPVINIATNSAIVIDTLPPGAPTITSPAQNSTVSSMVNILGTCEAGDTVSLLSSPLPGNFSPNPATGPCDGTGHYNIPIDYGSYNGHDTILATQTDPAGNTSPSTTLNLTVDSTSPSTQSILRHAPLGSPTGMTHLVFEVTFTKPVINVTQDDFIASGTANPSITGLTMISSSVYDVEVDAANSGVVDLNIKTPNDIQDTAGHNLDTSIGSHENYVVDSGIPTYLTQRFNPLSLHTNSTSLTFMVIFSEDVQNVDPSDFNLTTGAAATGVIDGVIEVDPHTYKVHVTVDSGATGQGVIDLNVGANNITDSSGNAVDHISTSFEVYVVDTIAPTITDAVITNDPYFPSYSTIMLTYDENLDESSIPNLADFTLTGISCNPTISSISITGKIITMTTSCPSAPGDAMPKISYHPTGPKIQDLATNPAVDLSNYPLMTDDGDGVPASEENAGPNAGDGNGDTLKDSEQPLVTTLTTTISSPVIPTVTLEVKPANPGGVCVYNSSFTSKPESALEVQDDTYLYPIGLIAFSTQCQTPQTNNVNIKLYLDKVYDTSNWMFMKYSHATHEYKMLTDLVPVSSDLNLVVATQTVGGRQVTTISYDVMDNGPLDTDSTLGVVADDMGPAVMAPVVVNHPEDTGNSDRVRRFDFKFLAMDETTPATTTVVQSNNLDYCNYFTGAYAKIGDKGPIVTYVQKFLDLFMNENLIVDGLFGKQTEGGVKRFQENFFSEILSPWGLKLPTGHWYQSTEYKARQLIGCPNPGDIVLDNGVILRANNGKVEQVSK